MFLADIGSGGCRNCFHWGGGQHVFKDPYVFSPRGLRGLGGGQHISLTLKTVNALNKHLGPFLSVFLSFCLATIAFGGLECSFIWQDFNK